MPYLNDGPGYQRSGPSRGAASATGWRVSSLLRPSLSGCWEPPAAIALWVQG